MRISCLPLLLLLTVSFSACKKTETEIVPDNNVYTDPTISQVEYESYVNRCYIMVRGREPDSSEMLNSLTVLQQNNFNAADRKIFLDTLFNSDEYRWQTFNSWRIQVLNNSDSTEWRMWLNLFVQYSTDPDHQFEWPVLQAEIIRMNALINAPYQYVNKQISVREMQRILANNFIYDQLNMGSVNFVNSIFSNYLNRYPTQAELQDAVSMVDGSNAAFFLHSGSSKDDFLNILFASGDYEEAAVIHLYQRYLNNNGNPVDVSKAALKFHNTGDYEQIQKDILVTDAFALHP